MTRPSRFPDDPRAFEAMIRPIERSVDTSRRLPEWVWRPGRLARVDFCQYGRAIGGDFASILESLADVHGDRTVTTLVLEPTPSYYREHYGAFSAFALPVEELVDSFWECLSYEPGGDPTGAAAYTADVVSMVGDSGRWAVWGERSWDLAIVLSDTADGSWLSHDVPFVPVYEALAAFAEPDYKTPLPSAVRSAFLTNYGDERSTFG